MKMTFPKASLEAYGVCMKYSCRQKSAYSSGTASAETLE